jgi:hypothetical protein
MRRPFFWCQDFWASDLELWPNFEKNLNLDYIFWTKCVGALILEIDAFCSLCVCLLDHTEHLVLCNQLTHWTKPNFVGPKNNVKKKSKTHENTESRKFIYYSSNTQLFFYQWLPQHNTVDSPCSFIYIHLHIGICVIFFTYMYNKKKF